MWNTIQTTYKYQYNVMDCVFYLGYFKWNIAHFHFYIMFLRESEKKNPKRSEPHRINELLSIVMSMEREMGNGKWSNGNRPSSISRSDRSYSIKMDVRIDVFAFRAIKIVIESAQWMKRKSMGAGIFCGSNAMPCGLQWSGFGWEKRHMYPKRACQLHRTACISVCIGNICKRRHNLRVYRYHLELFCPKIQLYLSNVMVFVVLALELCCNLTLPTNR